MGNNVVVWVEGVEWGRLDGVVMKKVAWWSKVEQVVKGRYSDWWVTAKRCRVEERHGGGGGTMIKEDKKKRWSKKDKTQTLKKKT